MISLLCEMSLRDDLRQSACGDLKFVGSDIHSATVANSHLPQKRILRELRHTTRRLELRLLADTVEKVEK